MKEIIDILEDKDYDKMCKGELVDTILVAIKNGIPIPQTRMTEDELADFLNKLNTQPKTGHWVEGQTDNPNIHNILCSCCLEGYPSKGHANSQYTREKFQWCPKCGAKMVKSQESEDKE